MLFEATQTFNFVSLEILYLGIGESAENTNKGPFYTSCVLQISTLLWTSTPRYKNLYFSVKLTLWLVVQFFASI